MITHEIGVHTVICGTGLPRLKNGNRYQEDDIEKDMR